VLTAIKIECWDGQDAHGSIELDIEKDEGESLPIIHLEIPMLKRDTVVSVFLEDIMRAFRQLNLK
jgi:hypothetical protein